MSCAALYVYGLDLKGLRPVKVAYERICQGPVTDIRDCCNRGHRISEAEESG